MSNVFRIAFWHNPIPSCPILYRSIPTQPDPTRPHPSRLESTRPSRYQLFVAQISMVTTRNTSKTTHKHLVMCMAPFSCTILSHPILYRTVPYRPNSVDSASLSSVDSVDSVMGGWVPPAESAQPPQSAESAQPTKPTESVQPTRLDSPTTSYTFPVLIPSRSCRS